MQTVRPMTPFCPGTRLPPQRSEAVRRSLSLVSAGTGFTPGLQEGLLFKGCDLAAISKVGPLPTRGANIAQEQSSGPLGCP